MELDELKPLLNVPAKFRLVAFQQLFPVRSIHIEIMRAKFVDL